MKTTQKVYLRHKLNPRKFGGVTLFRVSDAMQIGRAHGTAFKLRKTGRIIRVDSFQGGYAVWVSVKKRKVSVDKGRLGLDDSSTKYLNWLLPEFWYVVKGNKDYAMVEGGFFVGVVIVTPRDSPIYLMLYEHPKFLEIYSISATVKGTGDGTIVMKALKKYVDSKRKGMILRLVKNYEFFARFNWLRQMPREYGEYDSPDYFYKVNPNTKLRHLWT